MSDTAKPFAFSQFVPGFDFLKSLTGAAASGSVPGLPSLSNWVAPTLSVEELDKRIKELKTVQFWLEQNVHALKATIQALEVQKMTLSTLRGMNVRMEDLANAFTRTATSAAEAVRQAATATPSAAAPEPEAPPPPSRAAALASEVPAAEEEEEEEEDDDAQEEADAAGGDAKAPAAEAPAAPAAGVVDPLQWWGALTQQFQQIASNALQDAAQLRMPDPVGAIARATGARRGASAKPKSKAQPGAARKAAPAKKAPAKKAAARKTTAARKAAPGRRR